MIKKSNCLQIIQTFCNRHQLSKFIFLLIKDFFAKSGFDRASSLSYTILLSFVPFLVSVASITTFFLPMKTYLRFERYLLNSNLPAMGKQVSLYIDTFHKHAGQLSFMSVIFLSFSAILMIRSLTHHLVQLYEIKDANHLGISVFILITVVLMIVFIGVGFNSYIIWAIKLHHSIVPKFISLFLAIFSFTVIYKFVPINHASFKHALIAGTTAAILFEAAKHGFVIYVKYFTAESILYGTLAILPILLLWLYVSCLILLLCANMTVILQKFVTNN